VHDPLYRSPTDRVIAGVAGGLATWLDLDPSLVRIVWVLLAIFSGGIFLLVYFVMMIVVPLPPPGWVPSRVRGPGAPPPSGGWQPGGWQAPGGSNTPPQRSSAGSTGSVPGAAPGGTPGWTPPDGWTQGPPGPGWSWSRRERTNAGVVFGVILVGLGIWFLIDQYVHIDWRVVWPVIVIVVGAALIAGALGRGRPPG
jgi:phage shock protein C